MSDSTVLRNIEVTLGGVKGSVDSLVKRVDDLNGRSVRAIEKLATHEERFASIMERLENIETPKPEQPKTVTWRDVKVGTLVLGGLWSVVQGVVWIVQQAKHLL